VTVIVGPYLTMRFKAENTAGKTLQELVCPKLLWLLRLGEDQQAWVRIYFHWQRTSCLRSRYPQRMEAWKTKDTALDSGCVEPFEESSGGLSVML